MRTRSFFRGFNRAIKKLSKKLAKDEDVKKSIVLFLNKNVDKKILDQLSIEGYKYQLCEDALVKEGQVIVQKQALV